jgi:DNA-binding transcriptional ArsR family regulator
MVKQTAQTDKVYTAFSAPTRRDILERLAKKRLNVLEIAHPYHISLPAVSKHLKVLEEAGLVTRQREGRQHFFALNVAPIQKIQKQLKFYERYWNKQLDSLEKYLTKEKKQ